MDFKELFNTNQIKECLSCVDDFSIGGLSQGERSFFVSLFKGKSVVIVGDFILANNYKSQLDSLDIRSKIISNGYDSPIFVYSQDLSQIKNLIRGVCDFNYGNVDVLILVCGCLFQKLPQNLQVINFEVGKDYKREYIIKKLSNFGYRKVDMISCEGEFAIRGDIVYIHNIGEIEPVRIDFFDETIESISLYSIENMNKKQNLSCVMIYPNTLFFDVNTEVLIENIKNVKTQNPINNFKLENTKEDLINEVIRQPNNLKLAWNLVFENTVSLLSVLNADRVIFDEPLRLKQNANLIESSNNNSLMALYESGLIGKTHFDFFENLENIFKSNAQLISFENISQNEIFKAKQHFDFKIYPTKKYIYDYKALVNDVKLYKNVNDVILFAGDKKSKSSLTDFFVSQGQNVNDEDNVSFKHRYVKIIENELFQSVMIDGYPLLFATNDLIKKKQNILSRKKSAMFLPKINDFVVHQFHGIGKCVEIKRIKIGEIEKDYFVIEYSNNDKLYLPTEQADSISAYVGGDEQPKLNKLGGLEFAKLKTKAQATIKQLAFDLLALYSERSKIKGFKFVQDDVLQQEFESCFEYEETPDQLAAINDIKNDMVSGKIMDRLVCGDVGFGKTEVAFRAIYKAILSGKQVAFLCPTTILAQQHYKNALKRFKDFMVNVKVLNRLVPKYVQEQTIKELAEGKVDLIIGTHRILSNDIVFKNLGLLVLDEEQKFGVGAKEKLKNLKKDISVLTMSATPIPRTLHISLSGIRDISLIESPPKNRLPVQSYVCEYDDNVIKEACLREINRGGQVFIVYNRVDTINDFAGKIKEMLPNIRVGVAHGQMSTKELEDAVLNLYNGTYQILVATSLIENGIDIPQANTLIVIDSDRLGLSSLYQLKGRIGRSNVLAYAYFTYKKDKMLSVDAFKRLDAISEFSSMGSGFKVAMRDLEIRGAGNLLGSKQHGHIEKIGYDLYSKMLDDTLRELEGKKTEQLRDVKIDIIFDSFLPEEYISIESERMRAYTDISMISSLQAFDELKNKFVSTYGELPVSVENLMTVGLIKNLAQSNFVKRIVINSLDTFVELYRDENIMCEHLHKKLEQYKSDFVLKFKNLPIIEYANKNVSISSKCKAIIDLLV